MEKDWVAIYTTDKEYQAHIVKDMLEDNSIQAVIINKHDSAYVTIGDIEVYVKNENAVNARHLIDKLKL